MKKKKKEPEINAEFGIFIVKCNLQIALCW